MAAPRLLAAPLALLGTLLLAACGAGTSEPVPAAWQGRYAFDETRAHSTQDRNMIGAAFRLEPDRLVFEGHPAEALFPNMPDEWRVTDWSRTDLGACSLKVRAGEDEIGVDFIGEPAPGREAIDVGFTFVESGSAGTFMRVRGGRFLRRDGAKTAGLTSR